ESRTARSGRCARGRHIGAHRRPRPGGDRGARRARPPRSRPARRARRGLRHRAPAAAVAAGGGRGLMARVRLDAELVRRRLARSRAHAAELIAAGRVRLDGATATKPATQLLPAQAVHVIPDEDDPGYASRGGFKPAGALDALGEAAPPLAGRRALDAGASTGGFTDVLLRRGVAEVVAVDVGYGQLLWRLQNDPRVTVLDRTNVRTLDPAAVAPAPDLVVSDLSFISLTLVLDALVAAATPDADLLLMVKPQFEVGKDRLGAGGVVRDPA